MCASGAGARSSRRGARWIPPPAGHTGRSWGLREVLLVAAVQAHWLGCRGPGGSLERAVRPRVGEGPLHLLVEVVKPASGHQQPLRIPARAGPTGPGRPHAALAAPARRPCPVPKPESRGHLPSPVGPPRAGRRLTRAWELPAWPLPGAQLQDLVLPKNKTKRGKQHNRVKAGSRIIGHVRGCAGNRTTCFKACNKKLGTKDVTVQALASAFNAGGTAPLPRSF